MSRRHRLGIVLIAFSAVLIASPVFPSVEARLKQANFNLYPAPGDSHNMSLRTLRGAPVDLQTLRGRVVILNFWKIDCPPCAAEKPLLERVFRKYAGRGLDILAVNLFDEPDRIRSFAAGLGLSFTVAMDPEKRVSVRKEALGRGTTTSFVVNSQAEAIYEIPGVPTTYLIDRNGRAVGYGVGMVDWEEPALTELLESLLGSVTTTARHRESGKEPTRFASVAPTVHDEPTRTADVQAPGRRGPAGVMMVSQAVSEPAPAPQSLPFQGVPAAPTVVTPPPPTGQRTAPPAAGQVRPRAQTPATTQTPAAAKPARKPEPPRTDLPPVSYAPSGPTAAGTVSPAAPRQPGRTSGAAPGKKKPDVPSAIPVTSLPAPAPAATGDQKSLPPLPPALPYVPGAPQQQVAPRNVLPDDNGTVLAEIPGSRSGGYGSGRAPAGPAGAGSLPPAQPVESANPIGGFILDSFGTQRPAATLPRPAQDPSAAPQHPPPASFFGQLNQDVQALGSGIRDTFSRILPQK